MIRFTHTPKLLFGTVLLAVSSLVAIGNPPQTSQGPTGKLLQVQGNVLINGTSAISGATVFSDSTITTGQNSSAVVSLGKLGRVEVLPDTTIELEFADPGVSVELESGRVRISSSSNVIAFVRTNDGLVLTTGDQRNEFVVDTSCGNTFVSVTKGAVELRAGGTVKQIAAGSQDSAGTATPGCTPQP
jgi:ferric-dicitrate binding protein FerR (iron transport regulator)